MTIPRRPARSKRDDDEDRLLLVDQLQRQPGRKFRAAELKRLTGGVPKSNTRRLLESVDGVTITEDGPKGPFFTWTKPPQHRTPDNLEAPVEPGIAIGIDLAWSPKNPTGLAVATVTDLEVAVLATTTVKANTEIVDFVRRHTATPLTIAIDAPTVIPNDEGMRECEHLLQQDRFFQRAHSTPYP